MNMPFHASLESKPDENSQPLPAQVRATEPYFYHQRTGGQSTAHQVPGNLYTYPRLCCEPLH